MAAFPVTIKSKKIFYIEYNRRSVYIEKARLLYKEYYKEEIEYEMS